MVCLIELGPCTDYTQVFPIYVTSGPHTLTIQWILVILLDSNLKTAATNYRAYFAHNMDFQKLSDILCVFNNFKTQTPQGL